MNLINRLMTLLAPLYILLPLSIAEHSNTEALEIPTCPSTTTQLSPKYHLSSNAQRMRITYGPFTAPSNTSSNHGMGAFRCSPPLPCQDCTITFMQAGLSYADEDNTPATFSTGMIFHHVVFQNLAHLDPMCRSTKRRERFFASGDERTPVDLTISGTKKFGYPLSASDTIAFGLEVMNLLPEQRDVLLTMTFEYIPSLPTTSSLSSSSSSSSSFHPVTPYWFDIGGCMSGSNMPAKPNATFTYSSPSPIKAPSSGYIAFAGSHLHDGGTQLELLKDGKPVCIGEAGYEDGHIASMSSCSGGMSYEKGDKFEIRARYDTKKYPAMKRHGGRDGELEPVMGIALVYAVEGYSEEKTVGRSVGKVLLVVILSLVVVGGAGYALWRHQRTTEKSLIPAWLRERVPGLRGVKLGRDGEESEGRLLARSRDDYVDEE